MANLIGNLASELYEDMGFPSGLSETYMSGWFSHNVGRLNILLGTAFSGVSGSIIPEPSQDVSDILKEMFLERYYERKAFETLNEARYNVLQNFSDEDTRISWGDRTKIPSYYADLKKEASRKINEMAISFKYNAATPSQVVGDDTSSDDTIIEEM